MAMSRTSGFQGWSPTSSRIPGTVFTRTPWAWSAPAQLPDPGARRPGHAQDHQGDALLLRMKAGSSRVGPSTGTPWIRTPCFSRASSTKPTTW